MCISTFGFIVWVAPTYANGKEGIVTVSELNVRSGPSTKNRVGIILKKEEIMLSKNQKIIIEYIED